MAQRKVKIGICHYRIGKTDGISLEIIKRKKALEKMGHIVKLISGPVQNGSDFIIKDLEFDTPEIVKIKKNAFTKLKDYKNQNELMHHIYDVSDRIKKRFLAIQKKQKFDYLFLHNIFSHGRHIAAAKAFYDAMKETGIKTIAVNHDFYDSYEGLYTPRTSKVKKYLSKYVPPKEKSIKHVTINSLSQKLLYKKIAQHSIVFPDTFEFSQKPWIVDSYNIDLLHKYNIKNNDLVILQATRIVERKAIEMAIEFVAELNKKLSKIEGKTLYNGKILDKKSKIILVFAGFVEPASREYWKKLQELMKNRNVKYKYIAPIIKHRRMKKNGKKIYSLWDAYAIADIVTYPSTWEGFGNQFLEAVFAKKPTLIFEYPVFTADIKPQGYQIISLGNKFIRVKNLATIPYNKIKKAVKETIDLMLNSKTNKLLNKNFQIGKKNHGEKALNKLLKECLK